MATSPPTSAANLDLAAARLLAERLRAQAPAGAGEVDTFHSVAPPSPTCEGAPQAATTHRAGAVRLSLSGDHPGVSPDELAAEWSVVLDERAVERLLSLHDVGEPRPLAALSRNAGALTDGAWERLRQRALALIADDTERAGWALSPLLHLLVRHERIRGDDPEIVALIERRIRRLHETCLALPHPKDLATRAEPYGPDALARAGTIDPSLERLAPLLRLPGLPAHLVEWVSSLAVTLDQYGWPRGQQDPLCHLLDHPALTAPEVRALWNRSGGNRSSARQRVLSHPRWAAQIRADRARLAGDSPSAPESALLAVAVRSLPLRALPDLIESLPPWLTDDEAQATRFLASIPPLRLAALPAAAAARLLRHPSRPLRLALARSLAAANRSVASVEDPLDTLAADRPLLDDWVPATADAWARWLRTERHPRRIERLLDPAVQRALTLDRGHGQARTTWAMMVAAESGVLDGALVTRLLAEPASNLVAALRGNRGALTADGWAALRAWVLAHVADGRSDGPLPSALRWLLLAGRVGGADLAPAVERMLALVPTHTVAADPDLWRAVAALPDLPSAQRAGLRRHLDRIQPAPPGPPPPTSAPLRRRVSP